MFLRAFTTHPFYSADGDGGSGGDEDESGKVRGSDILQKYGNTAESAMRLAERVAELENRNYRLRRDKDTLARERDALKGQVPGEGAAVLTAADVADLEAYRAMGKPAELKTSLEGAQQAQADLASFRRQETIRAAAEAHGLRAAGLGKLPSLSGKDVQLRDVTEDGATVKRAFVDDTPLLDYIQANDPEFLPALTAEQQAAPTGVRFVKQDAGSGTGGADRAAQFLAQQEERRKAQTNPLMKQGA